MCGKTASPHDGHLFRENLGITYDMFQVVSSHACYLSCKDASIESGMCSASLCAILLLWHGSIEICHSAVKHVWLPRQCAAPTGRPILLLELCKELMPALHLQGKLDAEMKLSGFHGTSPPGMLGLASTSSGSHSGQFSSIPVVGIPGSAMSSAAGPVHAWDIDSAEIAVCKRLDGSDWLLGTGSFGQVGSLFCPSNSYPILACNLGMDVCSYRDLTCIAIAADLGDTPLLALGAMPFAVAKLLSKYKLMPGNTFYSLCV